MALAMSAAMARMDGRYGLPSLVDRGWRNQPRSMPPCKHAFVHVSHEWPSAPVIQYNLSAAVSMVVRQAWVMKRRHCLASQQITHTEALHRQTLQPVLVAQHGLHPVLPCILMLTHNTSNCGKPRLHGALQT